MEYSRKLAEGLCEGLSNSDYSSPSLIESLDYSTIATPMSSQSTFSEGKTEANMEVPTTQGESLREGDVLTNSIDGRRFEVLGQLGEGVFGKVLKCRSVDPCSVLSWEQEVPLGFVFEGNGAFDAKEIKKEDVAVKIIRNMPAYFDQAQVEIEILELLTEAGSESLPIVQLYQHFVWNNQQCLVFEILSISLLELYEGFNKTPAFSTSIIERQRKTSTQHEKGADDIQHDASQQACTDGYCVGVPMYMLKSIVAQVLEALSALEEKGIIHCDIKPENILLCEDVRDESVPIRVKIIDFGSACFVDSELLLNIQTSYYRAPEVVLGLRYDTSIDLWSLGCVIMELFLGYPLFPARDDHHLLSLMSKTLGPPPRRMLRNRRTKGSNPRETKTHPSHDHNATQRDSSLHGVIPQNTIHNRILSAPHRKHLKSARAEDNDKWSLADLCSLLLRYSPFKRISASLLLDHPFVKGEKFVKGFEVERDVLGSLQPSTITNNTLNYNAQSLAQTQQRWIQSPVERQMIWPGQQLNHPVQYQTNVRVPNSCPNANTGFYVYPNQVAYHGYYAPPGWWYVNGFPKQ